MNPHDDFYDLLLELVRAEHEAEVVDSLRRARLWPDDEAWQPFGGFQNNYGTVGNQQADARGALTEKLVNSVDHLLLRECLRRGIDPTGPQAPRTMEEAAELFFGVPSGNLALLTETERRKMAEGSICLVVSGDKPNGFPTVSIVDSGEGQEPGEFPSTFVALHRSNKQRIPFVQGKFHMGGSGVLPYCSEQHNLQLIVSRRDPDLRPRDPSWGFTVVRRRRPSGPVGSSWYEYLAPRGRVPEVRSDRLPIWPTDSPEESKDMVFGTFVRLYEYQIPERTMAHADLYRALSRRLFRMVLPIRLFEHRDYRAHTPSTTLAGMTVRIDQDRAGALEEGFPTSAEVHFPGVGDAKLMIALFKKGEDTEKWMKAREAVVFGVNGQAHAFLPRDYYSRTSVNLRWIKEHLLVEVDCSRFDAATIERVFMPSRDRMRESDQQTTIESTLESFLHHHDGLKDWNERRHREAVRQTVESDEHTRDLLKDLVTANREVAALLFPGVHLTDPSRRGTDVPVYHGRRFPTYLRLRNGREQPHVKECPANSYCRIEFETDAENDYFVRPSEPGEFIVNAPDLVMGKSLWNGILTLTLQPRADAKVGEQTPIAVTLTTQEFLDGLSEKFVLRVAPPHIARRSPHGERRPRGAGRSLPEIREVVRSGWEEFGFDDDDVATIARAETVESFVNMDNAALLRFCFGNTRRAETHKHQFKVAATILALALESAVSQGRIDNEHSRAALREAGKIILPIINTLGAIDE